MIGPGFRAHAAMSWTMAASSISARMRK
jgi:hypothetical protein